MPESGTSWCAVAHPHLLDVHFLSFFGWEMLSHRKAPVTRKCFWIWRFCGNCSMSGIEWGNGEMWVEMQIELEIGLIAMAEIKDQRNFLIPGILVSINFFSLELKKSISMCCSCLRHKRLIERYSRSCFEKWDFIHISQEKCILFSRNFTNWQSRVKQEMSFSKILVRIILISILVLIAKPKIERNSRSHLESWNAAEQSGGKVDK